MNLVLPENHNLHSQSPVSDHRRYWKSGFSELIEVKEKQLLQQWQSSDVGKVNSLAFHISVHTTVLTVTSVCVLYELKLNLTQSSFFFLVFFVFFMLMTALLHCSQGGLPHYFCYLPQSLCYKFSCKVSSGLKFVICYKVVFWHHCCSFSF